MKAASTLPVKLQCVAAPTHCRGTVRLVGYSAKQRFDIASGHTGTVRVPLTARSSAVAPRTSWSTPAPTTASMNDSRMTVRR